MDKSNCTYEECPLPKNNNRYCIQLIYLLVSIAFLVLKPGEFTFLAVMMFTLPIVLDLRSTNFRSPFLTRIKFVFLVFNIFVLLFCVLGAFGCIIDEGDLYSIPSEAIVFADKAFSKKYIAIFLVIDLCVPVTFWFGAPRRSPYRARHLHK